MNDNSLLEEKKQSSPRQPSSSQDRERITGRQSPDMQERPKKRGRPLKNSGPFSSSSRKSTMTGFVSSNEKWVAVRKLKELRLETVFTQHLTTSKANDTSLVINTRDSLFPIDHQSLGEKPGIEALVT